MAAIYSIHEISKIYSSPYTIPTGNVPVTKNSIKVSLVSLSKEYQIQCKIYSMDYMFNNPVTFTDCYNPQHGYYYCVPRRSYKLKKGYGVTGIVNNANILAAINNYPLVDVYKMRFWFLLIAYTYGYTNKSITVNDLLTLCCNIWKRMYENGVIESNMVKQSIKNKGHKTFTVGNTSVREKNRMSHEAKFSNEERDYVLYCINIEGWSYRKSQLEFINKYGKKISLKTIENIVKAHKNETCLETTAPGCIHMPANTGDIPHFTSAVEEAKYYAKLSTHDYLDTVVI